MFEAYLAEHGNERPRTPEATHHRIEIERLEQWRGAWGFVEGLR